MARHAISPPRRLRHEPKKSLRRGAGGRQERKTFERADDRELALHMSGFCSYVGETRFSLPSTTSPRFTIAFTIKGYEGSHYILVIFPPILHSFAPALFCNENPALSAELFLTCVV